MEREGAAGAQADHSFIDFYCFGLEGDSQCALHLHLQEGRQAMIPVALNKYHLLSHFKNHYRRHLRLRPRFIRLNLTLRIRFHPQVLLPEGFGLFSLGVALFWSFLG